MTTRTAVLFLLLVGALVALPTSAHHSFGAEYDVNRPMTLTGVLTKIEWTNPHTHIYLDVKGDDGKVVQWIVETQAPGIMYPAGYRKDSFKAGDEVTVVANTVKNGLPIGRIVSVVTASGWTLGGINDTAIPPKDK